MRSIRNRQRGQCRYRSHTLVSHLQSSFRRKPESRKPSARSIIARTGLLSLASGTDNGQSKGHGGTAHAARPKINGEGWTKFAWGWITSERRWAMLNLPRQFLNILRQLRQMMLPESRDGAQIWRAVRRQHATGHVPVKPVPSPSRTRRPPTVGAQQRLTAIVHSTFLRGSRTRTCPISSPRSLCSSRPSGSRSGCSNRPPARRLRHPT